MRRQDADVEAKEKTESQSLQEAVAQRLHRSSLQIIPHLPAHSADIHVEGPC